MCGWQAGYAFATGCDRLVTEAGRLAYRDKFRPVPNQRWLCRLFGPFQFIHAHTCYLVLLEIADYFISNYRFIIRQPLWQYFTAAPEGSFL